MFCKTDSFLPLSCMSTWTISVKASRPIRISTLVLLILSNSNWNWKWRAVLAALWGCTLTLTFKHVHNDNANMLMLSSKCFWCIDVAISQLQNSQAEKKKSLFVIKTTLWVTSSCPVSEHPSLCWFLWCVCCYVTVLFMHYGMIKEPSINICMCDMFPQKIKFN